jgi:hypothetical protein
VKVTTRKGEPWVTVPKLEKLDEPTGLAALKEEVVRRWGVLDLLDVLKNADFATGFTDEFASVAAYERIDRATLQRRLLLALGTNMGIRAIVATGEHGESEAALRHVRRHFITVDNLRAAVTALVFGPSQPAAPRLIAAGTTASADLCPVRQHLTMQPVGAATTQHHRHPDRPPRIRTITVPGPPPRLRPGLLGGDGLRHRQQAHPTNAPHTRFVFLGAQVSPRASSRPHLTVTPLPPARG